MFNKNIILKIKNFNFQKAILLVIKFQIYWTIVYFVLKNSFGTASCAPFILRLFQDEKPQTIFNTDLTFGKIVLIAVAGYALFKCVDYAANQVYGFCRGIYEGFTGKEILTFEKKIDQLSSLLQKFNNNLSDVKTKLDSIAFDARIAREQLYFFDENDGGVEVLRENFRKVFREFADLKNAGNGLAAQIEDFGDMLRTMNSRGNTSPELVNLVHRMEEIRQSVNAWNDQQGRLLGESVNHLQEIISNLDNYNSEEINRAVSELRQNISVIQNVVEQSLNTFANPVLNEKIRLPEESQQLIARTETTPLRNARPTVVAQEPVGAPTRRRGTEIVELNSSSQIGSNNNINLTGLNPGEYKLQVLENGGVHIDPISSFSRTVAQEPNTFTNGLINVVRNPNVQDLIVSTGARLFASTMRQPSVPYMPYYPNMPMVPYIPQPSAGDIIANRGAEVGETAGRIIGKIGGAIFKGILGGI